MSAKLRRIFLIAGLLILITVGAQSRPNFNVEMIDSVHINGTEGCWGYVDSVGNEYALICASNRLEIWNVTRPESAVLVKTIPAAGSDLKQVRTLSHYAFAVNQGNAGLQVIDLQNPSIAATVNNYQTLSMQGGAHTVHIDGQYAYLGMNGNSPYSWRIIDIQDPLNLVEVGRYMTTNTGGFSQSHDSYVKGNIAYIAFLGGGFSIVDIRTKSLPAKISDVSYPDAFTHNCWTTEDGQYLFTTDEQPGGHLRVWDVRHPENPDSLRQVAEWMPSGITSIIHNVQVKGDYAYISYYADGVVILDIEDPTQPIEVGHYDTAPFAAPSGNYVGCWDIFPYFPSGTLVASNYSLPPGMWLLRFNNAKAGQIKGTIIDFLSGESVPAVSVRVLGFSRQTQTDSSGSFLLRTDSGSFRLEFSRTGFLAETVAVAGYLNDTTVLDTVRLKPVSLLPPTPTKFTAQGEPGGNIRLIWRRPSDSNLSGFRIYRAASFDSVNFSPIDSVGPEDSTYVDAGSNPGELFFYRIATVNKLGYTSFPSPVAKAMRFVFGSKLLLVDRTAYCSPYLKRISAARDSFYTFHARVLRRFDFDTLELNDCQVRLSVNPAFVARHPVIVLHSSEFFVPMNYDNASFLSFFIDYLKVGGKLIVESQWIPLQPDPIMLCDYNSVLLPNATPSIWESVRRDFGFDCLYYPLVHMLDNTLYQQGFASARSHDDAYPNLAVDSLRVDNFVPVLSGSTRYPYPTLPNVGYMTTRDSSEDLYSFVSLIGNSDAKDGKTVAKRHIDAVGNGFVWFNFSLYYMKEDSSKKALRQALADLGVPENFPKADFDRDGVRTIEDITYLINWVFLGEQFSIFDDDETDLNCNGQSSPADLVLLLLNVFPGQPLPCN